MEYSICPEQNKKNMAQVKRFALLLDEAIEAGWDIKRVIKTLRTLKYDEGLIEQAKKYYKEKKGDKNEQRNK